MKTSFREVPLFAYKQGSEEIPQRENAENADTKTWRMQKIDWLYCDWLWVTSNRAEGGGTEMSRHFVTCHGNFRQFDDSLRHFVVK